MFVECIEKCDVLVIGAGIAGISSAIESAKSGSTVVLTSATEIFSGSSFFPGTWGLGLIGPENEDDEADLEESIARVGCAMAKEKIVKTFVKNINPAIAELRARGVELITAENSDEKEFIPCFDHKKRNWNGLENKSMREVFKREIEEYSVRLRPNYEALELIVQDERVCGAVFAVDGSIIAISSKAVILATGGYGGLFRNYLTTSDVMGSGQAMALRAGVKLINMEFMQMMPGFISPAPKTVFNEKTFRFATFSDGSGNNIFEHIQNYTKLLEQRSTHGPFTSAKSDREIDFTIAKYEHQGGVYASYIDEMKSNPPEFIKTYFDWLREKKKLSFDDAVRVGIYAHAANGGIEIGSDASTGVEGLYACGEVSGGMHGADRIGGLSSANGLVFGKIAGQSATAYASTHTEYNGNVDLPSHFVSDYGEKVSNLRRIMTENAMISRNESRLKKAIDFCEENLEEIGKNPDKSSNKVEVINYYRLKSNLFTAMSILKAALLRKESRGSHYREDYPDISKSKEKRIVIALKNAEVVANYEA